MAEKTNDVIGLGNTLMDFLIELDDRQFLEFNLTKGEMHLVDERKAKEILDRMERGNFSVQMVPGGSAANTLKGIAFLGGKVILCGKVGNDKHGAAYIQEIEHHGVSARIGKHPTLATGHAIGFITPDAQRTFSVHLGAAIHFSKDEVVEEDIENSKILHLEGYQLEGPTGEAVLQAMNIARKAGTLISIDLADPGVIRRNMQLLRRVVQDYVDILFVNEEEAREFTGVIEEEAVRELGKLVSIAVVKIGKRGSWVYANGKVLKIDPYLVKAVDTTGAGDSYAAGFLYGYSQGWPLEQCGKLGSLFASKIVETIGVRMNHLNADELKRMIKV